MKFSLFNLLTILLVCLPTIICARHISSNHSHHGHHHHTTTLTGSEQESKTWKRSRIKQSGVAGSTLPDCSHACGSCTPCRLVMVSFVCASIEEAESCPVTYRCMCKNKSYPVP